MAFFRGIGNAFGTVAGAVAAPFDNGKFLADQSAKTAREFSTVANDVADSVSKDGALTQLVENIPVAGYAASLGHHVAGNVAHCKRAYSRASNSTVALVIGAGAIAMTPVSGGASLAAAAAVAGVAGSAAGSGVQAAIETTYTDADKEVVGQEVLQRSPQDWAIDLAAAGAVGGVIGSTQSVAKSLSRQAVGPSRKGYELLGKSALERNLMGATRKVQKRAVEKAVRVVPEMLARQTVKAAGKAVAN